MKVKTNLKPSELNKIGDKLKTLASQQQKEEIALENPAEKEMMRRVDSFFDIATNNLQDELARILLDKD